MLTDTATANRLLLYAAERVLNGVAVECDLAPEPFGVWPSWSEHAMSQWVPPHGLCIPRGTRLRLAPGGPGYGCRPVLGRA